jgi:hypothetical protein
MVWKHCFVSQGATATAKFSGDFLTVLVSVLVFTVLGLKRAWIALAKVLVTRMGIAQK